MVATATPTSRPLTSTTGPPLFPGLRAPSICTTLSSPCVVETNARNGPAADGDGGVTFRLRQGFAEWKSKGEDRRRFRRFEIDVEGNRLGSGADAR